MDCVFMTLMASVKINVWVDLETCTCVTTTCINCTLACPAAGEGGEQEAEAEAAGSHAAQGGQAGH